MARKKSQTCTITWAGDAGIEQASALQKELLKAFDEKKTILLDLSQITDIDISALQLIVAAEKESKIRGVAFQVLDTIPDNVMQFIKLLDFPLPVGDMSGKETADA